MRERTKVDLTWAVAFIGLVGFASTELDHLHGWDGLLPFLYYLAAILALNSLHTRARGMTK